MPGKRPYLIVGSPVCDGSVTILAENIFDVGDATEAQTRFAAERRSWWDLLQNNVESHEKKRSAKTLLDATPKKKWCQSA